MGDESYYRQRERQERALAKQAKDPVVRALHEELADKYAARGRLTAGQESA